jgi:hypothetical protein
MEQSIQGYLGSLQVGEVQLFKNLAMVPVISDYEDGLGYITLGEALGAGSIEIREVSEGGSVPELRVVNRAGKMVLILDGEELVGAKQNRIVNTTILIAAGSEIVIPVSCVEQGRWTYKSDAFSSKQRMMSPSIRQVKAKDVSASLRSTGRYRSDQSAIWQEVAGLASRRGAVSESMDMDLVFDKEAPVIKEYLEGFTQLDRQVGAVFLVNGKVVGMDAFGNSTTFSRVFKNLLESYALDAVDRLEQGIAAGDGERAATDVLAAALAAKADSRPSVGLGTDLRLESDKLVGFALEHEKQIVHLCLFPNTGSRKAEEGATRIVRRSTRRQQRKL